jgi:hypothetical protein
VLWRKPRRSRVETRGTARAVSGTPRRGNDPSAALHACCVLHQRAHSSLPQHHARTLARRAHGWRMGLGGRTRPVSPLPVSRSAASLSIERRLVLRHSASTHCVPSATALALLTCRRDSHERCRACAHRNVRRGQSARKIWRHRCLRLHRRICTESRTPPYGHATACATL